MIPQNICISLRRVSINNLVMLWIYIFILDYNVKFIIYNERAFFSYLILNTLILNTLIYRTLNRHRFVGRVY